MIADHPKPIIQPRTRWRLQLRHDPGAPRRSRQAAATVAGVTARSLSSGIACHEAPKLSVAKVPECAPSPDQGDAGAARTAWGGTDGRFGSLAVRGIEVCGRDPRSKDIRSRPSRPGSMTFHRPAMRGPCCLTLSRIGQPAVPRRIRAQRCQTVGDRAALTRWHRIADILSVLTPEPSPGNNEHRGRPRPRGLPAKRYAATRRPTTLFRSELSG
jgi:hypothetical protein